MNYSFRKKNKIVKYIVIHYTGMKNLKLAYQKLSDKSSNVSTHYLISRNGIILNILCPKFKAWHAGKSKWKSNTDINEYSIGIELENKGHEYGYSDYTKKQYIIFHSDIAPNRKKDPGERFVMNSIGITRFYNQKKVKKKYSVDEMLLLYGFHKSYIKKYKNLCIKAVKRTLNYSKIDVTQSKKFKNDFYNLIFS
jgi:N-acetylmuramoyl-L-alanine amidase